MVLTTMTLVPVSTRALKVPRLLTTLLFTAAFAASVQ